MFHSQILRSSSSKLALWLFCEDTGCKSILEPLQNHFDGDFEPKNSDFNPKIISERIAGQWEVVDYSVSCASGLSNVDSIKNIIYKINMK